MVSPPPARRLEYTTRALAVVLGGSLVHLAAAHLLLWLAVPELQPGQRPAVNLVVLFTALVSLAFLYVRTQYSSPDHAARSVPWILWLTPPSACALFLPITLQTAMLEGSAGDLARVSVPVVGCTWSSGLFVGSVVERAMRRLAARHPPASPLGELRTFAPPTLAGGFGRLLPLSTAAGALIALSVAAARQQVPAPGSETLAVGIGIVCLVLLAAAAGASLGQSPGQDIVSIARRLDALGYGARVDTIEAPVVVTGFDEVGELLARLEELRSKLAQEMRQYERALERTREADAAKSEFLSAVSHELRTPLNAVGGFAQLLLEGVPAPLSPSQSEDVRLIQAGGRQLLELINDILDMSMIESGELRLSYSPTNVAEVIEDVVRIHQPLLRDKPVELSAEVGPDLPAIVCDRRRLTQILTNLVSNAIKFTERGSITIRAAFDPRQNGVVIRCIDTGVGIEADDLDAIFEEYRQVGSVKRRKKGTGLGLAIARRIAGAHGGSLTVRSSAGEGSTFTLHLPLDPPNRPATIDIAVETARNRAARQRALDEETS